MYFNSYFSALIQFPGDQIPYVGFFRPDLVLLSVAIAVCGAYAGLSCLREAETLSANDGSGGILWKIAGGLGFGGSIWGMHFIGMLAFSLPCGVAYDFLTTSLSIIPAVGASLTALAVVSKTDVSLRSRLLVGSVLMGAGIGTMHYAGMAAMRMPAILFYEPRLVALSIVAAIVLSFIALAVVEYGQRRQGSQHLHQALGALILGAAVATMHYVAMNAAVFYPVLGSDMDLSDFLSPGILALLVGLGTLALAGGVAAAAIGARLRETARNLADEATNRRIAERAALADQARLQAIFDTAVEAIVVIDAQGLIRQWSKSAERIFGYGASEILGRNVAILTDGITASAHDGFIQRYLDTGEARIIGGAREITGRRKDGTVFHLEISVGETVIDEQILFTGILRDITQRKAIEYELLEATRAKEANEMKSNFLAHMSHEMRTPLNAILGFSDMMRTQTFGPLDGTYRSYAEDIFSSGDHLLGLVNALLDLSKIEQNAQDLDISDVQVRVLLTDAVSMMREQVRAKNLTVTTLFDSALPATIRTDRGKLYQVLINLIANAVKYTPDGNRISIRAWPQQDGIQIMIEDTGVGMTDDEIDLALKPFGQVKNAFTSDVSGTGLGLPIVVSFVELLQGELTIMSRKDYGTKVAVILPHVLVATSQPDVAAGP